MLETKQILKTLESLNLLLTLVYLSAILKEVDGVLQLKHHSDIDLYKNIRLLQISTCESNMILGNFPKFLSEATKFSRDWSTISTFKTKNIIIKKK